MDCGRTGRRHRCARRGALGAATRRPGGARRGDTLRVAARRRRRAPVELAPRVDRCIGAVPCSRTRPSAPGVPPVDRVVAAVVAAALDADRSRAALAGAVPLLADDDLIPQLDLCAERAPMLSDTFIVAAATNTADCLLLASELVRRGHDDAGFAVLAAGLTLPTADDLTRDTFVALVPGSRTRPCSRVWHANAATPRWSRSSGRSRRARERRRRHARIQLGDRSIGEGHACYVIAEVGANHNRDLDVARRLIDAVADAGVDAVKFQTYSVRALDLSNTPRFDYLDDLGAKPVHELLDELCAPANVAPSAGAALRRSWCALFLLAVRSRRRRRTRRLLTWWRSRSPRSRSSTSTSCATSCRRAAR